MLLITPFNSAVKRDLCVLSGLTQDKGRSNGDGPGDHARSAGVFLTGVQPLKSEGSEIRAGISVDQFAAQKIGHQTRFASLELGTERGRQSGKCDSGYSCAYSNNVSWRDGATPMAKETNPRLVFERLFGNDRAGERNESLARRQRYRKSLLDFVLEDARSLTKKVSGNDRQKLDEYLVAVREIEQRIERAEDENAAQPDVLARFEKPEGVPDSYEEHIRLMGDMMILAFQTDVTRVSTFMLANAGTAALASGPINASERAASRRATLPPSTRSLINSSTCAAAVISTPIKKIKMVPDIFMREKNPASAGLKLNRQRGCRHHDKNGSVPVLSLNEPVVAPAWFSIVANRLFSGVSPEYWMCRPGRIHPPPRPASTIGRFSLLWRLPSLMPLP